MVIPNTPLYNSKSDAEFRLRMINYIKSTFRDILSPDDLKLLDLPNGLDLLQERVNQMLYEASNGEVDLRKPELKKVAA